MPTVDLLEAALFELTGSTDPHPRLLAGAAPALIRLREGAARAVLEAPDLGTFRRRRLVAWDRERVTWEAWDPSALERVLVQAPRPGRRPGPPLIADGVRAEGLLWVSDPFRWSLADLLPVDSDPIWVSELAGAVLRGLVVLHQQGLAHGQISASTLVERQGGWRLVPLHGTEGSPEGDLRDVGHLLLAAGAAGPLHDYAETLIDAPPPNVQMAIWMLRKQLVAELTRARHDLVRRVRSRARYDRVSPLRRLTQRLFGLVRPPVARGVVRAAGDQSLHLVTSDGVTVRGGLLVVADPGGLRLVGAPKPRVAIGPEHWARLPTLWDRDSRDATGVRATIRAWRTRPRIDEQRREQVQAELGGDEFALGQLMRWLEASARLRAELILMRAANPE